MDDRECEGCGRKIPRIRLEILPLTTRCARCSTVRRVTADEAGLDGPDPEDMKDGAWTPQGER